MTTFPIRTGLPLIAVLALAACSESGGGSGDGDASAVGGGGGLANLLNGTSDVTSTPPARTPVIAPDPQMPAEPSPADTPRPPSSDDPLIDDDGDGFPDSFDTDADGDGLPDTLDEGFPDLTDDGFVDTDGDGLPDALADADGDGVPDLFVDVDGDGIPDLFDEDIDGLDEPVDDDEPGAVPAIDPTLDAQAALTGLWDATGADENGRDVAYLEFTALGDLVIYDYLGDEFAANDGTFENCYLVVGGPLTALGDDVYRLDAAGGSRFLLSVRRDGENLVFGTTDPDNGASFTVELPPLTGVSPTDLNACG